MLVLEAPEPRHRAQIGDRYDRDGVFDPLATWVVALCKDPGWPALNSDPARPRRLDPTLATDDL